MDELMSNPILSEIIKLFKAQQDKGLAKYGKLVNVDSHTVQEWISHQQQECLDQLVYLECLKQKINESPTD